MKHAVISPVVWQQFGDYLSRPEGWCDYLELSFEVDVLLLEFQSLEELQLI